MKRLESALLDGASGCLLSDDAVYRYVLWRTWDAAGVELAVVMLNPSTATHDVNDATIRTLMRLAHFWSFGGVRVVNLFALRSTDPRSMRDHPDPIGPGNDAFIAEAAALAGGVMVAWGSHGTYLERAAQVLAGPLAGLRMQCLGITKSGEPRHPLYARNDAQLEDFHPKKGT